MRKTMKSEEAYIEKYWRFISQEHYIYFTDTVYQRLQALSKNRFNGGNKKTNLKTDYVSTTLPHTLHNLNLSDHIVENLSQFKDEIKKQLSLKVNGFNDIESFLIDLYQASPNKKTLSFINKLCKTYRIGFIKLAQIFREKLSEEEFKKWWIDLPDNIIKVTNYKNEIIDVYTFVKNEIKTEKQHEYLYYFINKRVKILNRSETKSIVLRDILISHYQSNLNLLQEYSENCLLIKNYLKLNKNSSYLEERFVLDSFYIELNYEKMKAILAIPNWKNNNYKSWLSLLLDVLYKEHEEILNIRHFDEKDTIRNQSYLSIYIAKNKIEGLNKKQVEAYIVSFFNHLTKDYNIIGSSPKFKIDYIEKWFAMEKLNQELLKKGDRATVIKI